MAASTNSFTKQERLSSRKLIEQVIAGGRKVYVEPFRLSWIITADASAPAQLAIAVPKRSFRKAADRNRIRRLIREAYRTNKSALYTFLESRNLHCAMLLVYTGREMPEHQEVRNKIILTLQKLEAALEKITRKNPAAAD